MASIPAPQGSDGATIVVSRYFAIDVSHSVRVWPFSDLTTPAENVCYSGTPDLKIQVALGQAFRSRPAPCWRLSPVQLRIRTIISLTWVGELFKNVGSGQRDAGHRGVIGYDEQCTDCNPFLLPAMSCSLRDEADAKGREAALRVPLR